MLERRRHRERWLVVVEVGGSTVVGDSIGLKSIIWAELGLSYLTGFFGLDRLIHWTIVLFWFRLRLAAAKQALSGLLL
jgi:cytochrome c oxidase subunit IV